MADPVLSRDEVRARLGAGRVAVLGCGGLGSNVAVMLVRAGVRTLVLADFDAVEESNLDRQSFFRDQLGRPKAHCLAETLRRIEPDLELTVDTERFDATTLPGLIAGADVVVEAVDTAETKVMIARTAADSAPDTPLVTVSGLAGFGPTGTIVTEQLAPNVWLIGDLTSDVRSGAPLISSRVMTAAAQQAHAVVRLLLGLSPA